MSMKKRSKKLIDKGLQLRVIVVFMTLAGVCSLYQIAILNWSLTGLLEGTIVSEREAAKALQRLMITNAACTLLILCPLMAMAGVVVTHRIAGPAYRMRCYLEGIAKDGYSGPCAIRRGDELQSLCKAVNIAVDRLRVKDEDSSPEAENLSVDSIGSLVHEESPECEPIPHEEGSESAS